MSGPLHAPSFEDMIAAAVADALAAQLGPAVERALAGHALGSALTLSIAEAADMLGISTAHAYKLAQSGELPAVQLGGTWRVSRLRLVDLVEQRQAALG